MGHPGVVFFDTNWIEGEDYKADDYDDNEEYEGETNDDELDKDDEANGNENKENTNYRSDSKDDSEEDEEEEEYIEQTDIDEILGREQSNPAATHEDKGDNEDGEANIDAAEDETLGNEEEQMEMRCLTRVSRKTETLNIEKMTGKTYAQLENCPNLVAQVCPNPNEDVDYSPSYAMLIACTMSNINTKVTIKCASFAQQYMLQKGLKVFGKKAEDGAKKELDQLYQQNCFTPISVEEMTPRWKL